MIFRALVNQTVWYAFEHMVLLDAFSSFAESTNVLVTKLPSYNWLYMRNMIHVILRFFHVLAHTGFHDDYFYIVKHTLTAEQIRIKVAVGDHTDSFDERVSRTIAFTADKVRLTANGIIHKVGLTDQLVELIN